MIWCKLSLTHSIDDFSVFSFPRVIAPPRPERVAKSSDRGRAHPRDGACGHELDQSYTVLLEHRSEIVGGVRKF